MLSFILFACTTPQPQQQNKPKTFGLFDNIWMDPECYGDSKLVKPYPGRKPEALGLTGLVDIDLANSAFTCYNEYGITYLWFPYSYWAGIGFSTTYPVPRFTRYEFDEMARKFCEREHNKVSVFDSEGKKGPFGGKGYGISYLCK